MRWLALSLLVACGSTRESQPQAPWLRGQLHAHSGNSGDSRTAPDDVVRWYREHRFDFLVLTDHNFVTVARSQGIIVIPGAELTQNLETCEPPIADEPCLLHVNALFVSPRFAGPVDLPFAGAERERIYAASIEQARALGGFSQINHPNFHYGANARLISRLVEDGAELMEVSNESVDVNNDGDGVGPSTEQIWDAVLTSGARIWGTATDDAHQYDDAGEVRARGRTAFVGNRGWVMVQAARNPAAIRAALLEGRFYFSNGVELGNVEIADGALRIETASEHTFRFIGAGGQVLAQSRGTRASHPLIAASYVRAVVEDGRGHRAWTQPAWR